jgi:hypothetical protein
MLVVVEVELAMHQEERQELVGLVEEGQEQQILVAERQELIPLAAVVAGVEDFLPAAVPVVPVS